MANVGRALQQASQAALQAYQVGLQAQQQREAMQLNRIRVDTEKIIAERQLQQLQFDKTKEQFEKLEALAGISMTPDFKDNFVKYIKSIDPSNTVDFNSFFSPDEKGKDGAINTYKFNSVKSIVQEYDNKLKQAQTDEAKGRAALSKLQVAREKNGLYLRDNAGELAAYEDYLGSDEWKSDDRATRLDKLSKINWSFSTSGTNVPKPENKKAGLDVYNSLMQVNDLNTIAKSFNKDFFTIPGKIKKSVINAVLKSGDTVEGLAKEVAGFGEEEKDYARQYGSLWRANKRELTRYVNLVSGAQFAVKEFQMHQDSLFNPDQTYVDFQQAFNEYVDFIQKGYRIAEMVKSKGIPSDEAQAEINSLLKISGDPSIDFDNIKRVGDMFKKEYKTRKPDATEQQAIDYATKQLIRGRYIK